MRKIISFLLLLLVLTFSGCSGSADKGKFFDYQNCASDIKGIWKEDSAEYGVILTLGEMTDSGREKLMIEFTSPEEIKGTKYVFENGILTATLGDMTTELNAGTKSRIFRLADMFSLKSEDIKEIKVDENGNTAASGKNWKVITDKEGEPKSITLAASEFIIEDFETAKAG